MAVSDQTLNVTPAGHEAVMSAPRWRWEDAMANMSRLIRENPGDPQNEERRRALDWYLTMWQAAD